MTRLLQRSLREPLPLVAASARGCEIFDRDGHAYIDGSGGAAVACLGHGHPEVIEAMRRQIDKACYVHTAFFTTDCAEQLGEELIAHAPGELSHAFFVSGGSEAMESALKLARQYFVEIGQPQRQRFIARRQSYHGNTLGALSVGGNAWRRAPFEPILLQTHHVSPCFEYRFRAVDETPEAYGQRLAAELEDEIVRLGPTSVAAFIAETVVGATAGAVAPVPNYFRAIREVCDRYGVLLILDEVMCGMGRTGVLHACESEGVAPDLLTLAKGLGGGYAPIGALLAKRSIIEALTAGSGAFMHGHTYGGHPLACAAALAVQQIIRRDDLIANVRRQGEHLERALRDRLDHEPSVGDIRGRGLFWAVEFVSDRQTKAPFDPALKLNALIKAEAMARGLIIYPMGGTVDGRAGDHVLIAPPFIADAPLIETVADRFADAVAAALLRIGRGKTP